MSRNSALYFSLFFSLFIGKTWVHSIHIIIIAATHVKCVKNIHEAWTNTPHFTNTELHLQLICYLSIIIWANPRSDLKSTSILFYFHKVVNMQFVKLCALVGNQTMTLNIYMESPAMYTRQKDFEFFESIFIQLTFFHFPFLPQILYFKAYESTCNAYTYIDVCIVFKLCLNPWICN